MVDEKYLLWLAKGAHMRDDEQSARYHEEVWYPKLSDPDDPVLVGAKARAIELGLATIYNEKWVTLEQLEKIKTREEQERVFALNQGFHGQIGDKLDIRVRVVRETSFDTDWGRTYIVYYQDVVTEKIYIYMGGSPTVNAYCYLTNRRYSEEFNIKASIKEHKEYKGVQQTYLQRVSGYIKGGERPSSEKLRVLLNKLYNDATFRSPYQWDVYQEILKYEEIDGLRQLIRDRGEEWVREAGLYRAEN
jgi:hypothetical protein